MNNISEAYIPQTSALFHSQKEVDTLPDKADKAKKAQNAQTQDTANISQAGKGQASFSSSIWSNTDNTSFDMSTYTAQGTLVEIKSGIESFTFGSQLNKKNLFKLADADGAMNMEILFTHANGKKESFTITESTRLIEDANGQISLSTEKSEEKDIEDKSSTIMINLDDNAVIEGSTGDDVLFNFGRNALIEGQEGNDVIMSMGDGAKLSGGEGNDLLKVVRDVIRKENVGETNGISAKDSVLIGFDKGISGILDGGEGDDTIEADVKLNNATILGGGGNDKMHFEALSNSIIDGGEGDDDIKAETLFSSKLDAGDGNDKVNINTVHGSSVDGGKGNDNINITTLTNSSVDGGAGDDNITVTGSTTSSQIKGGDGDDKITVSDLKQSTIKGDTGNDTITAENAYRSVIDGGAGNDNITIEESTEESLIIGGTGDDNITLKKVSASIIDGGRGNDSITANKVDYSMVLGGEGNDNIRFEKSFANVIDGETGDDLIIAHKNANLILNNNYTLTQAQENLKGTEQTMNRENYDYMLKRVTETMDNLITDSATNDYYRHKIAKYKEDADKYYS